MKRKAGSRLAIRSCAAITLIVEEPRWRKDAATLRLIRRAARLAVTAAPHPMVAKRAAGAPDPTANILLANDESLKALNRNFRGRNKPTNVLSFAGDWRGHLGDVAIAYETAAREARVQRKNLSAHAAHLAMHGVLHLLGYDHQEAHAATAMESLEISLLAKLGIVDPYAPRPLTRAKKAA
jgi:probable rRNA maturation factor